MWHENSLSFPAYSSIQIYKSAFREFLDFDFNFTGLTKLARNIDPRVERTICYLYIHISLNIDPRAERTICYLYIHISLNIDPRAERTICYLYIHISLNIDPRVERTI